MCPKERAVVRARPKAEESDEGHRIGGAQLEKRGEHFDVCGDACGDHKAGDRGREFVGGAEWVWDGGEGGCHLLEPALNVRGEFGKVTCEQFD